MTAPLDDDEDEMTDLYDADFPRVDLVGKGANGIPRFLIAKQDADSRGLVPPDLIRDLIGKQAEPEPEPEREQVTMTGSPAAIAKLIHEAAQNATAEVAKAKNDTADRKHKASTGAAMADGSYPIANEADLTKAIHAVGRGGSSHNAIRKHIISRAKSLGASSKIPDNWNSDGSLKGDAVSKTSETVTKDIGPELDDGVDGMDPTVPLAEPDEMGPGDPTDPGSPAWESIDAATAQKWTSIAVRLKNALSIMADREMLEAATADPGDADSAWDLQDAQCAVDYVIDTLAGFAVGEQAEADLGGEAMEAIGKALASFDPAPLAVVEGFAAIRKAGRVLSSTNEARIRDAAASLQSVLASLPAAPQAPDSGQPVATAKETAMAATETQAAPSPETVEKEAAAETPAVTADTAAADAKITAAAAEIAKADGDDGKPTMQAVFNQDGDLIGIVDPSAITPVSGAGASKTGDGDGTAPAAPAADAGDGDLTPQPPADAGTPADAVDDDGTVTKQDATEDNQDIATAVAKSVTEAIQAALTAQSASHEETVTKQAAVIGELTGQVEVLKGRVEEIAEQPAAPRVFTNGQTPPAHMLRGQDQGAPPVDVAKALARKRDLYGAPDATAQNEIAKSMQADAIEALASVHRTRR